MQIFLKVKTTYRDQTLLESTAFRNSSWKWSLNKTDLLPWLNWNNYSWIYWLSNYKSCMIKFNTLINEPIQESFEIVHRHFLCFFTLKEKCTKSKCAWVCLCEWESAVERERELVTKLMVIHNKYRHACLTCVVAITTKTTLAVDTNKQYI